jgi:16S rRNA processing protein RimM
LASEAAESGQWVTIASVVGSRGNRGEVQTVPLSDRVERFGWLSRVYLFGGEGSQGEPRPFEVERVWQHGERIIFKFRGIDTISDAERLRGCEIRVPRSERAPLAAGEYYQSDLVGCEVVERLTGRPVGRVKGWRDCGGPVLLEVEGAGGEEILIPFANSICAEIDLESRRIGVDLPEGLRDLNG